MLRAALRFGVFLGFEMALSSANRMRLASAAEEGNRAAEIACKVIDKYENALSAILIGNNLCNIGSDSIVTVLGIALLGEKYNGWVSVLITLCMTAIIIVFCESAPKIAAKKNANRFSMTVAPFVRFLMIVLSPVIFLVRCSSVLLRFRSERAQRRKYRGVKPPPSCSPSLRPSRTRASSTRTAASSLRSALDFRRSPSWT